ncbi:hypothetical protein EVAR_49235_1 [Eumeta japonica]|uniref:Uncharacterized protein n=1 Tax=Eumeta variegata TaxID=151549 RepID=A0A4C1YE55_EUMVA|nr:hypothetical protein EVAR_49235_1 [Eumeta japonica]
MFKPVRERSKQLTRAEENYFCRISKKKLGRGRLTRTRSAEVQYNARNPAAVNLVTKASQWREIGTRGEEGMVGERNTCVISSEFRAAESRALYVLSADDDNRRFQLRKLLYMGAMASDSFKYGSNGCFTI